MVLQTTGLFSTRENMVVTLVANQWEIHFLILRKHVNVLAGLKEQVKLSILTDFGKMFSYAHLPLLIIVCTKFGKVQAQLPEKKYLNQNQVSILYL